MLPFVITIIFIIQVVLVLAVINLTLRQKRLLETEKSQERAVRELEETMSSFIMEIKEENDKFLEQLTHTKKNEKQVTTKEDMVNSKAKVLSNNLPIDLVSKQHATSVYQNNISRQPAPTQTFEERVQKLYAEGHSATDIAKLLNKGTTEIELLIKFRQKEQ